MIRVMTIAAGVTQSPITLIAIFIGVEHSMQITHERSTRNMRKKKNIIYNKPNGHMTFIQSRFSADATFQRVSIFRVVTFE